MTEMTENTRRTLVGRRVVLVSLALGTLVLAPFSLKAQDDPELRIPSLGPHKFTTSNFVPTPFITTRARNTIALGEAVDVDFPVVDIGGEPVAGLDGDLLFAGLAFTYQQAIKSWIAVRGKFQVTGRLGNGALALLTQGVTYTSGFEFTWLIKLARSERTMLSGELFLNNNSFTALNVRNFIEDIVAGESATLTRKTPALRGGGGLTFAWGASDLFGLTVFGHTGYGEPLDRRSSEFFYRFGGAVDFDVGARSPVPLGLSLAYRQDSFPESGNDIVEDTREVAFRTAYNGTKDFLIALDFTWGMFPIRAYDEDVDFATTAITLEYYF